MDSRTYYLHNSKAKFARTVNELELIFRDFCKSLLGGFEVNNYTPVLANYLKEYVCESYGVLDHDAMKIVLYHGNKDKFARVLSQALQKYKAYLEKNRAASKESLLASFNWSVPEQREYDEASYKVMKGATHHALQPYAREIRASKPEVEFEKFLEQNGNAIKWWYKNGNNGLQHFAIPYTNKQGDKALFYVDYIIKMKNGEICLFDTKSMNSDPEAPNKHNALIDYINDPENAGKNLKGGVIIESNGAWRYCQFKIEGTDDLTGWTIFNPIA
ncbi:MAG: hypothetical protein HUJ83_08905 [Veillonella sp.]|nr:hypothetical protein [Veillonella sp.]